MATLSFLRKLRAFARNVQGVAAVEMAFIAPIGLGVMSVGVLAAQALTLHHKVVLTAHAVTDLVSRTPFNPDPNTTHAELITEAQLNSDLALAAMVMYPHDITNLSIVMSEVQPVSSTSNQATVKWSRGFNGGVQLTPGTTVTLDSIYPGSNNYLLLGQVSYTFRPLTGIFSLPPITLVSSEVLTIRYAQLISPPVP